MEVEIKQLTDHTEQALIKEVVAIERQAFGEGALNYWGVVQMIHYGLVYIIYVNSKPAGLVYYMREMIKADSAYLYSLVIADEYRDRGFGSQLLDYSLAEVKKYGVKRVELTVAPDHKKANYLYQTKFGFKKKDFRKDEYGPGEDRVIMELNL
ncbi:GNAT family N-acetyltransferase [Natroniella sulfidigena]|uniref:GNAT family N-acetyltransferase n=1 Tax=Natroniella sulfidigena TaxID=723921 RepID=UPI00200AAE3B|nr:GNAT family N-acetyltransferase [Natroniella sulfidigena]